MRASARSRSGRCQMVASGCRPQTDSDGLTVVCCMFVGRPGHGARHWKCFGSHCHQLRVRLATPRPCSSAAGDLHCMRASPARRAPALLVAGLLCLLDAEHASYPRRPLCAGCRHRSSHARRSVQQPGQNVHGLPAVQRRQHGPVSAMLCRPVATIGSLLVTHDVLNPPAVCCRCRFYFDTLQSCKLEHPSMGP